MIDIFVKSFNRPYYLDRCLQSIEKYVRGHYKIVVLDDGTPEKYLEKIKSKFPQIEIRTSEQYHFKVKSIQENLESGKQIDGFKIPTKLWKEAVKDGSEYMIMTEDDVWFTEKVHVDDLVNLMKNEGMIFLKLGWISRRKIKSEIIPLKNSVLVIKPKIFIAPRWFMRDFFFRNKWKVFSLMYKLGIVDNNTKLEYWCMNGLLMGMFRKDYWLAIWDTLESNVDEKEQLVNAVEWYRKNKQPNLYGKLDYEMMNTTYITSATNSYHKYGDDFDVNRFNFIMNEEWFYDRLDSMNNFPKDISEELFYTFLNEKKHIKAMPDSWKNWAEKFKEQYRKQSVKVD